MKTLKSMPGEVNNFPMQWSYLHFSEGPSFRQLLTLPEQFDLLQCQMLLHALKKSSRKCWHKKLNPKGKLSKFKYATFRKSSRFFRARRFFRSKKSKKKAA